MDNDIKTILGAIDDFDKTAESVGVELRMSFAKIINRRRLELHWTQEQLAEKAGVAGSFVSRVLHGENVTIDTIANLLHALGLRGRLEEVARIATPIEKPAFFKIVATEDFAHGKKQINYQKAAAFSTHGATLRSVGQARGLTRRNQSRSAGSVGR